MPPGHVRAPVYLRGKTGQIERAIALWGPEAETPEDWIEAELYEHWIKTGDTADAS
jgi:hypothetical protein